MQVINQNIPDSIFASYVPGNSRFSPALFWEYDMKTFCPSEHKEIVVARVAERGRLNDFFAAFDACGGIDGFRETYRNLKEVDPYGKKFICLALNIKRD
ncbi:MAG: DUF6922 domain-containing protein [Candidatus Cryptobacteroides sp.]